MYDQAFDSAFHDKLDSIQCDACLAITGVITSTSRQKLYQESGRCFSIPVNFTPVRHSLYTISVSNLPFLNTKHSFLKNYFSPSLN